MKKVLLTLFHSVLCFVGTSFVIYGLYAEREGIYYAAINFLIYSVFISYWMLRRSASDETSPDFYRQLYRTNILAHLLAIIASVIFCLASGEYLLALYPIALLLLSLILYKVLSTVIFRKS